MSLVRHRRQTTVVAVVLLVATVAMSLAVAVSLWPREGDSWNGPGAAAGALRYGDLMVVGRLETSAELAALVADCRTTGATAGPALARAPAGPRTAAARGALGRYLAECAAYDSRIVQARAEQGLDDLYQRTYRFTGSMRASDGTVFTCEDQAGRSTDTHGTPLTCWTADRTRWPSLAAAIAGHARFLDRYATSMSAAGCATPEMQDVCDADVARYHLRAVSLGVFAAGLARGDTGVFRWLGVNPTVGVAEQQAAVAARDEYWRRCRAHGFADSSPTAWERDRMREWAATVRTGLTGWAGR